MEIEKKASPAKCVICATEIRQMEIRLKMEVKYSLKNLTNRLNVNKIGLVVFR